MGRISLGNEMNGFERSLEYIRAKARSAAEKGLLFERLMKRFLEEDLFYRQRFSQVWLWGEWVKEMSDHPDFQSKFPVGKRDFGIDLVARLNPEGPDGTEGYCAIQCKCFDPDKRISKADIQNFLAATNDQVLFPKLLWIDTGYHEWGVMAAAIKDSAGDRLNVLNYRDLSGSPFDWPDLASESPEALRRKKGTFNLRPHQRRAKEEVIQGFETQDRGKLIMACGTGKTFTALRIAESIAGKGGRVLYLVPSISLAQQSMREWSNHQKLPHRYIGICSDTSAGIGEEEIRLQELEIPVTTDPFRIAVALKKEAAQYLTVVFCTYQSLELVQRSQDEGAPAFDLALCDEAHQTTGVIGSGGAKGKKREMSPFVLIHHEDRIRATRRLYMTATPRLYTEEAKGKAKQDAIRVFSMDDEKTYGPEFHRLSFSQAVDERLLTDFRVVILGLRDENEVEVLHSYQARKEEGWDEVQLGEVTQMVGCWQALKNPNNKIKNAIPLGRVIAFTNSIKMSKRYESHWEGIIEEAAERLAKEGKIEDFRCRIRHVDGTQNAATRQKLIDWLKESQDKDCRILVNARCLSEGVDVPALDAVIFLEGRKSHVDIVQAVGRSMRRSQGKKYGYIIIPVAAPEGVSPESVLDDNERFSSVWKIVNALRAHDEKFNAEINQISLGKKPDRIIFDTVSDEETDQIQPEEVPLPLERVRFPPDAFYAKLVQKCGQRQYWENWAKDVANIFTRLTLRIQNILNNQDQPDLKNKFNAFHQVLKKSIHESVTRDGAIDMLTQHIITGPVFDALFDQYFSAGNPVASALNQLQQDFERTGLQSETRDLEGFYESVRARIKGITETEGRQKLLMELYEKFFATALKKEADRLGIVYTPVEIVDFILHSTDYILRNEFGSSLGAENVHILDPFTGTGIFLSRLLHSGLISDQDMFRKYISEMHANEIVLLAYYIAAVNIEEAFRGQQTIKKEDKVEYVPFNGIVLTDTFNLRAADHLISSVNNQKTPDFPKWENKWKQAFGERADNQNELPIQVIVGNPPWSAKQRSSADENPNTDYPELEERIEETYVKQSTTTNKNSLYDTYKMAIRWASDRIENQGVIAFVTNGSWIDGIVDSGVRASLEEEFDDIYVLNLRGHTWKGKVAAKTEGAPVFGQGSSATVAVMILVKKHNNSSSGCRIQYKEIYDYGDYLKREDKLNILREVRSIAGIKNWNEIKPNSQFDWINQRNESFLELIPIGSKEAKSGKSDEAIFRLYANGFQTKLDAYLYNFSKQTCVTNAERSIHDYQGALTGHQAHPELSVDYLVREWSRNIRWHDSLKARLIRGQQIDYSEEMVRPAAYRPFTKQFLYGEPKLAGSSSIMKLMFPASTPHNYSDIKEGDMNRVICVSGIGSNKLFSVLMVNFLPDMQFIFNCQCFPRWSYPNPKSGEIIGLGKELVEDFRMDNIVNRTLLKFREHYIDETINKDNIFNYVYGILHSPNYREQYANDLRKSLPRIPFAPDFYSYANAGRELRKLHLTYDTIKNIGGGVKDFYPLEVAPIVEGTVLETHHFRIGTKKMKFLDPEQKIIKINEHVKLTGIPASAHRYVVNGRTPLEWFIDRYHIKTDKHSGITNDPNGWFEEPEDLVAAFRRIVQVSVETVKIVESLPSEFN